MPQLKRPKKKKAPKRKTYGVATDDGFRRKKRKGGPIVLV